MTRVSQKSMLRYGTPIRPVAVRTEVAAALLEQAKLMRRSVGHTASVILEQWYETDWKWYLEQRKKGAK